MAKDTKGYNDKDELTFLRALFSTLIKELHSLVEENRKAVREVFIIRTEGVKIAKGQYVIVSVKADTKTRTTIPYLDFIHCDQDELEGEIKELIKSISSNPKNTVTHVVNVDDKKSFKNTLRTNYNLIAEDSTALIDDAFEEYDTMSNVLSILGQIIKDTMANLNEAIEELDEDDKENFRRSRDTIELEDCVVRKKGRQFTFSNGIILDVLGFDSDDDEYDSVITSVSYKIKRECKDDSMY